MEIATVLEEEQVNFPEAMQKDCGNAGEDLIAIAREKAIPIEPKNPFKRTTLSEVVGCLKYQGTPNTVEEMNSAISQGIKEQWHDLS